MTLEEAQARLPPGFEVSKPQTGLRPEYTVLYAQKGKVENYGDAEGYTLEAVDGKIAYISHVVQLSASKAVDRQTYISQIKAKYGQQSAQANTVGPYASNELPWMHWTWDKNGMQTPFLPCPGGVGGFGPSTNGGAIGVSQGVKYEMLRPGVVSGVPSNRDLEGCHVSLFVSVFRNTSSIGAGQINLVEFQLVDQQPFFTAAARDIAADKQKQIQQQKVIQQRQGPPM